MDEKFFAQRFDSAAGGGETITTERFGAAFPEPEDAQELFAQTDQDGNGTISRDEWMKWQEEGFTAATTESKARMPAAGDESME